MLLNTLYSRTLVIGHNGTKGVRITEVVSLVCTEFRVRHGVSVNRFNLVYPRSWREGKFIILDDSFEHEVWQEGNSIRVILIVDIWHPCQKRLSLYNLL